MIIWQGFGIMALILPILLSLPFSALFQNSKAMAIGWLIGGIILFLWGKKLHNPETNITILYDENGQGYKFKKHNDTLFWIPMEYCGILWIVGSVIYLFTA